MPSISRKICSKHKKIYSGKSCQDCDIEKSMQKKRINKEYDRSHRNQERKKFYNSAVWKKLRVSILSREPICRICKRFPATAVDHICPISQGGGKLNPENLQPICQSCHSKKTLQERNIFYPGWMPKPLIPVTLVCGSIGSGKNYYVNKHKADNDLVIDFDEIKAKLSGKDLYHWEATEMLEEVIMERNKQLASLSLEVSKNYHKAWFIVSAPKGDTRKWWADRLNADIVLISTNLDTCINRINHDDRRLKQKENHIALAKEWFSKYTPCNIDFKVYD